VVDVDHHPQFDERRATQIRFGFTPRAVSASRCAVTSWASVEQRAYPTNIMATA